MRAQSNHPFDPESNAHYLLRLFDGWMGDANGPQKVLLLSAAAVLKNPSPAQLSASPQRCCERGREDQSMAGKIYDHPYVPRDLELPGYVPCALSQREIVVPYIGTSLLGVVLIWLLSGRLFKISKTDRLLMCWWAFTGLTHIILEGYFAFSPEFYKEKTPFFLAEVWKEYSKGDSRYAGRDAAVVSVEGITAALEGPASLLAVYAIATRKPYSYILQFAICLGQLYGCLVYFATAFLLGDNFSTSPFYYWAYYIGANSSWCVVPVIIAIRCWKKISAACASEKKTKTY